MKSRLDLIERGRGLGLIFGQICFYFRQVDGEIPGELRPFWKLQDFSGVARHKTRDGPENYLLESRYSKIVMNFIATRKVLS